MRFERSALCQRRIFMSVDLTSQHCLRSTLRLIPCTLLLGMPLKSVDWCGNIREPCELDERFFSYENPWDDPYSDLSKYFSALNKGKRIEEMDVDRVSAAVDLVSFRNIDDWCYVEQFDKNTLTQVTECHVTRYRFFAQQCQC